MTEFRERCLGWPVGTECRNLPGTQWGPYWCGPCNVERLEHISAQIDNIIATCERSQANPEVSK
jgi:hypothetical protein